MFNSINSVKIKQDEYCYVMIKTSKEEISCTVYNAKTEKVLVYQSFVGDDVKNFINKIYFNSKIYKAIIVHTCEKQPEQFRVDLREKLNELKIAYYFIDQLIFYNTCALIGANVSINFGETIFIIQAGEEDICWQEFKFTPEGYERLRFGVIKFDEKRDRQQIREKIMELSTPKKILVVQHSSNIPIRTILKSKKSVFFDHDIILQYPENFVFETCKWLFDKSRTKYYILPFYERGFNACLSYSQIEKEVVNDYEIMMSMPNDTKLPLTKSEEFGKSFLSCWIQFTDVFGNHKYSKVELDRRCHRFKLTMDIDTESFETYQVQGIFLKEIRNLPQKLDIVMKPKIPVIGFFDDSAVVCICKSGRYQFSESCNGEYGMDNFISFDQKKPKFGEAALQMMAKKASFVTFDLRRILSMPADNIQISKNWKFTITKDCDNPVLIEFDDFKGGKRRAASPAFLMALLIKKQYLKAITAEIGEKPSEIGICMIRDKFNQDEMKRIKQGIEDACNLIKIKCCFVDC